MHTIKNSLKL